MRLALKKQQQSFMSLQTYFDIRESYDNCSTPLSSSGGHHYDKNQIVLNNMDPNKEQQLWDVELLWWRDARRRLLLLLHPWRAALPQDSAGQFQGWELKDQRWDQRSEVDQQVTNTRTDATTESLPQTLFYFECFSFSSPFNSWKKILKVFPRNNLNSVKKKILFFF